MAVSSGSKKATRFNWCQNSDNLKDYHSLFLLNYSVKLISFSLFINERNKCILLNTDDDDKDSEDKDAHIRNGETVPK